MTRRNNLIILISCIVLIVVAGCNLPGGSDDDTRVSGLFGSGSSSSGGTGVDLTFAEGNPSSEIIKGQPVTFAFVFKNYQEHEITDLKVKTKNFDTGYVQGLASDYSINTIPRYTEQTGAGVYSGQIVEGVKVDNFNGKYNFNPIFDYCYSAKTQYREQICVPSKNNQCNTNIEKASKENGPIGVSIDRITAVENNVRIDFTITNKGAGQVVNECFKTDDYANSYDLKVTLGTGQGNCEAISGQNIINSKSNFYCTFARSGDDSYASQVVVELDYLYQQTTTKNIIVQDLNEGYE